MADDKPIYSFLISKSAQNFRALMAKLADRLQEGWVSSEGIRLVWPITQKEPPTYLSWIVFPRQSEIQSYASIEVYEIGETIIEFWDGRTPSFHGALSFTPIGPAFKEFIQWIFEEAEKAGLQPKVQFNDAKKHYHNLERVLPFAKYEFQEKYPYLLDENKTDYETLLDMIRLGMNFDDIGTKLSKSRDRVKQLLYDDIGLNQSQIKPILKN